MPSFSNPFNTITMFDYMDKYPFLSTEFKVWVTMFFSIETIAWLVIPMAFILWHVSSITSERLNFLVKVAIIIASILCTFCLMPDSSGLRIIPLELVIIPILFYMRIVKDFKEAFTITWISLLMVDVIYCAQAYMGLEGQGIFGAFVGIGQAGFEDGLFNNPIFSAFIIIMIPKARIAGLYLTNLINSLQVKTKPT